MEPLVNEMLFWLGFILLNALHFVPHYLLDYRHSSILPYVSDLRHRGRLGLIDSLNQDPVRFVVEWSLLVLVSRLVDLSTWALPIGVAYLLFLLFNGYQYTFRRIYETEPNFYNDGPLLKNGLVIVWHESPWKVLVALLLVVAGSYGLVELLRGFLNFNSSIDLSLGYWVVAAVWLVTVLRSIQQIGFYRKYPNDIFNRYHFTAVEIIENIGRSWKTRSLAQQKIGAQLSESRAGLTLELDGVMPNLYFIFVESYGSYLYRDAATAERGFGLFQDFRERLEGKGRQVLSQLSTSTTTGGQSWLTYSSFLYGLRISDNIHFEKYLRDPDFRDAKSLLQLLSSAGYTNYNLNPISPIKGINVPYDDMRTFYSIDHWFLKDDLGYEGDVYGFGECPPDQFSMNHALEYIRENEKGPFTFFYLTKNSHSPFITPKFVADWRQLNHDQGQAHIHRGFLAHPTPDDYVQAISYQLENLADIIEKSTEGIFVLIGDHQPPMLSNPEIHGLETPVHIVSSNPGFADHLRSRGFQRDFMNIEKPLTHEGLYSVFLETFSKTYGSKGVKVADLSV